MTNDTMLSLGGWKPMSVLPPKHGGPILKAGELGLMSIRSKWTEFTETTRYAGSSRAGVSLKIGRGARVFSGSSTARYKTEKGYKDKGDGILFLTDQRLVFVGLQYSMEIKLVQILAITYQDDGLAVRVINKPTWLFLSSTREAQHFSGLFNGVSSSKHLPVPPKAPGQPPIHAPLDSAVAASVRRFVKSEPPAQTQPIHQRSVFGRRPNSEV